LYNSIFVGRVKNSNKPYEIEYIGHKEGFNSSEFIELDSFSNSEYILLVHLDHHSGEIVDSRYLGFVSIYTKEEFIIFEKLSENEIDSVKLFDSLIYDYYENFKFSFTENLQVLTEDATVNYNSFGLDKSNYGFILFENLSLENSVNLKLTNVIETEKDKVKKQDSGIINRKINGNYNKMLLPHEYFIFSYYNCGVTYEYSISSIKSKEQLKKEVITKGAHHLLGEMEYLSFKHDGGIIYMFQNPFDYIVEIKFELTKVTNLVCYEFYTDKKIEFYIPPYETYFLFFEKEEIDKGFNLENFMQYNQI
jgi:hypothetical protein